MTVEELLVHINEEDSKVHLAVKEAIPQIRNLVEQIEARMKKGGVFSTSEPEQAAGLGFWTHRKFLQPLVFPIIW